jgi:hypothetical protein
MDQNWAEANESQFCVFVITVGNFRMVEIGPPVADFGSWIDGDWRGLLVIERGADRRGVRRRL